MSMDYRLPKRVLCLAIGVTTLSACESTPTTRTWTVSDSAGIQVVKNFTPAWKVDAEWKVSAEPTVDIGVVEGDPNYQLDRVGCAVRLQDGRVVVANSGSGELRFFDETGRHLFNVGRKGEGPGEFGFLGKTWRLAGDSIATFDMALNRVSVFTAEGDFVRSLRLEAKEGMGIPSPDAQLADGSLLVISGTGSWGPDDLGLLERSSWILSRYSSEGHFLNILATFPSSPRWGFKAGGVVSHSYVPFKIGTPGWAAGPNGLYAGSGKIFEIELRDLQGNKTQLIRRQAERRPVTESDVDQYRQYVVDQARNENSRRRQRQFVREVPFPDHMPTYRELLLDDRGYLWVEHYRAPWERQPHWSVFDPRGRWLGEIETPMGLTVLQIGADYILGRRRDDLDVQHVVVFGLQRG